MKVVTKTNCFNQAVICVVYCAIGFGSGAYAACPVWAKKKGIMTNVDLLYRALLSVGFSRNLCHYTWP